MTSATTGTQYVEGTHYAFDGADKTSLRILRNTIAENEKLKVSWYQSGVNMIGRWGTPATSCALDNEYYTTQKALYDKLYGYFGNQATADGKARYFMYYDEIRLMNWDPFCALLYPAAGESLRQTVNGVADRITGSGNGYAKPVELLVWNDMFDKQMNAIPRYWHVKGDLGKWTTPLRQDLVIVNWAGGSGIKDTDDAVRTASLKQFAAGNHKQVVALYYDNLASVGHWADVMNAASPDVTFDGVMYTTWKSIDSKTPYAVP